MLLIAVFLLGVSIGGAIMAALIWHYQVECELLDDEVDYDEDI